MSETDNSCKAETPSLALANNHLAVNLHRLLAEEKENVFFSPFSISTAMAMLLCAADGETESEMRAALGHDHAGIKQEEITSMFKQQMSLLLKNRNSYTLFCANSMLSQKSLEVKDRYKKILAESFKALLLEVDFKLENQKAANQVNHWVKKKTKGMIKELVQSLDPETFIVLLNAVYFKGTWLKQFKKRATTRKDFYNRGLAGNAKQVDMMFKKASFSYYVDSSMQALKLPYIGEDVAMLVLLPWEINGLEKIEASLTPSFLQDLVSKLRKTKIEVFLPKFRLEYNKSLVPCFQRLGINRVFRRGAELGVASDSPDLAVSEILHKAVLEVNEKGSVAFAVTMVRLYVLLRRDPVFCADHPFAFLIYNTKSNLILFMGRVEEL